MENFLLIQQLLKNTHVVHNWESFLNLIVVRFNRTAFFVVVHEVGTHSHIYVLDCCFSWDTSGGCCGGLPSGSSRPAGLLIKKDQMCLSGLNFRGSKSAGKLDAVESRAETLEW